MNFAALSRPAEAKMSHVSGNGSGFFADVITKYIHVITKLSQRVSPGIFGIKKTGIPEYRKTGNRYI